MQVITDSHDVNAFLCNIRNGFVDQFGWQNWYVLEITSTPPLTPDAQKKVTELIREKMDTYEGNIYWPEGSVFTMFQKPDRFNVERFAETLPEKLLTPALSCRSFSVSDHPQQLEDTVRRHVKRVLSGQGTASSYTKLKQILPNIDGLLAEWAAAAKTRIPAIKPTIMVVDDDPMALQIVTHIFGHEYSVFTATNGLEAIQKHLDNKPDIIFLDIGLPDIDGITLLNCMRVYDSKCRIVMFSADDDLVTRAEALAHGARGFAAKPFNRALFTNYISTWSHAAQ